MRASIGAEPVPIGALKRPAIISGMRCGLVSGASSTNHAPSWNRLTISAPTFSEVLVFPTPPEPTSVTRRLVSTRLLISSISVSRPTNEVTRAGRFPRCLESVRSAGKALGRSARRELMDFLRFCEIPQVVHAEPYQARARRQCIANQFGRGSRNKDLAAVPGRKQPSHSVERPAEIVTIARVNLAGVHSHPNL